MSNTLLSITLLSITLKSAAPCLPRLKAAGCVMKWIRGCVMADVLRHSGRRLAVAIAALSGLTLDAASAAGSEAGPPGEVADMDIADLVKLRVSPFDVSTRLDTGYRASNAVSGSRFDTPIRDLPFAIQAFTESFIADQKPVNIFDVARYSPGVTYRSNDFTEGNANLAIRGFAISATPGNVQILRDGFHGPSIVDFTNISRVEVVKGPASFLYGQVAPGGIVNIITKSPQPRFTASAEARYGSYGQYRIDVDVTGPLSPTLFYRVAASHDQDMHYWEPYDADSRNISPSLLWQPHERVSVSLKYEHFSKRETPPLMQKPGYGRQAGIVPSAADPNLLGVDVPGLPDNWNSMAHGDYRRSDTSGLSAWADFRLDDRWNLRAAYSRQAYTVDSLFSGNLGMANNSTQLQGRRLRRQTYTNHDLTYEAQAVGKYEFGDTSLRLLLGGQYVERRFDDRAAQAPNDPALGSNPTASPLPLWDLRDPATWNRVVTIPLSALTANPTDRSTHFVDKSIYAGTTFGFFEERLLVLAGWRRTATRSQLVNHLLGSTGAPSTANAVTPQYGLLYKLRPELSFFASYAKSFVPGSQLLLNLDGTTQAAAPTRGRGHDIGLKTELFGGRLSGTLTFFDIRNRNIVNDLAATTAAGSVVISNVQSGEQRSRGFELDTTIRLTDRWQAYLSYSHMNARITEFSGHDAAILAQDPGTLDAAGRANYKAVSLLHNAPLQMSAPHLANLWTRYDFVPDGRTGAYVGGGLNAVRDQTILPDGPKSSHQTYTLVNALLGYAWGSGARRVSVELMGKNLSDEHYRPSQSTRARPREFLLTVKASL
ncbi:TonB-dependent siderophore receptor [Aquabacterium sp.]|uniref:TonB-dependent siderophore receptor n=1 Tax=Aquabacterium sp. TaxID=1872578 RepID=UPI002C02A4DD|nr:TonB-dependent receptor [Aquabacterium sp.]HSW08895.1 TonB-dependent receptor [Aquabacterium sp.]